MEVVQPQITFLKDTEGVPPDRINGQPLAPNAGTDPDFKNEIASAGYGDLNFVDGHASLPLTSDFNVDISVVELQDGYQLYISDKFLQNGTWGPFKPDEIAEVLDKRSLDAFFSQKIQPFLKNPESVSEISDEKITGTIVALVGTGAERGHKLENEDKLLIGKLIEVLVDDDKAANLSKKINFLHRNIVHNKPKADLLKDKIRQAIANGHNLQIEDLGWA